MFVYESCSVVIYLFSYSAFCLLFSSSCRYSATDGDMCHLYFADNFTFYETNVQTTVDDFTFYRKLLWNGNSNIE